MELQDKQVAMEALLCLLEAERILRSQVPPLGELPQTWRSQLGGSEGDGAAPAWSPRGLTVGVLLPMLSRFRTGGDPIFGFLPPYQDQYETVIAFRNAIGLGDWERLAELGGAPRALEWAECFQALVATCAEHRFLAEIISAQGGWQWPPPLAA